MSIPRIAIARPITMFMISAIIILLGAISVTRLPVDLLPDVTYPRVSVMVRYPGVGPQEIEQLITRPIEQTVSAVAGLEVLESSSNEGSSRVSLAFAWGTDLNEAMDDMRMRLDRVRGRLPLEAEPMQIFRQDSNAMPIMSLGIEGNYDRVTLREMAENQIGPRLERVDGVAAVTTFGGLRRQIHVQLSKEKVAALDLPVERITALLRSENQNTPLGEVNQGERTYLLRSQAQFQSLDEIRNLVLMTRGGVPIYVRDIAEVVDTTEDLRSILRINGRPGVRLSVQKQSGTNTVQVSDGIRAEIERINTEMPNIKLNVLDDSAIYIRRSINSVQEHALLGAGLVTLIIFCFLRSFRSTLIVCTSIPISVIGTFALLYFAGYTLNIMTFGGLALGIGMVVDAAIVVLENAYRHMEHGKDRVTAAIEGSEEVWGAIVASGPDSHRSVRAAALPHGHLEHSLQAALGRRHLLAPDVAARGRHDRAGAVRSPSEAASARSRAERNRRPHLHRERAITRRHGRHVSAFPAQGARTSAHGSRAGSRLDYCCGADVPTSQHRACAPDR